MRRRLTPPALAAVLGASVLVLGVGPVAPAQAVPGADCLASNDILATDDEAATDPSAPLVALQVPAAQQLVRQRTGRPAGAGVRVAVVDSGVRPDLAALPRVDVVTPPAGFTTTPDLKWAQGTAVAGIIAGATRATRAPADDGTGVDEQMVGIAPGAAIVGVRVYDAPNADDLTPATSTGVAAGLNALVPLIESADIRVVTVALEVTRTPELDAAVAAVTGAGAIVVAAAGDRTGTDDDPAADYELGEDRGTDIWPAGYARGDANPRVVAATSTAPEGGFTASMLQSSAIDVAVPTQGAVSYGLSGTACTYGTPSSAVAAAVVSGVLALLITAYPDDTPDQIIARLQDTATGGGVVDPAHPDLRVGHGVVQPLEALDRALAPDADGTIHRSVRPEERAEPAALPVDEPDVLAGTRRDAVWWGLLGGGALLLAVLLRPVLSRRRTPR